MSYIYVTDQGAIIGVSGNRIEIKYKDGMIKSVPIEPLECVEVFGNIQLTTQCITTCLKRGITVLYYSTNGAYFGRLISPNHINVARQRKQAALEENEKFKIAFSKKIIKAKINNQIVVLRRYTRRKEINIDRNIDLMKSAIIDIEKAESIEEIMGHEGQAARLYFNVLSMLIDSEFVFKGRTKRPPLDPFNSLISLGYSIILNEIYGKLEGKGLNPYFGIMHKDKEKHPTLASDLMEEWRAVLIDTTAMGMINGHELLKEDFYQNPDGPGVFLTNEALKKYIGKLEIKFRTDNKYLDYVEYAVSFRRAIELQINQFVKAIENEDANLYSPIMIR
jgi:CRISPR-associated protein Cas1